MCHGHDEDPPHGSYQSSNLSGRKLWLLASSGEEGRSLVPNNVPESQPGLLMVIPDTTGLQIWQAMLCLIIAATVLIH